jgi:hypothetical protein
VLPPTLLASGHEAPETEPVAAPGAIPVHDAPVADEREPVAVGVATAPFTHEAAAVTATNVASGADNGLTARVPGTHLTHFPSDTAASNGEAGPRPESVHDMLSRHERGKRDGHGQGAS